MERANDVRVLHIHGAVGHPGGGGGIAMHRLHRALCGLGVDSKILVLRDEGTGPDVSRLPRVDFLSLERRLRSITRRLGLNDVHRLGSFQLDRHTFYQNADIVHFHCMHSGVFSYLALPRIARSRPVVHTLHDMWAFTGHCGYSYECQRWKIGCGDCPHPAENPPIERDATRIEWRLKSRSFLAANVRLISKTSWTTRMARVSALRDLPLAEIPYGVDTRVYRPLGRERSRDLLGLSPDRHVLLFSAQNLSSPRKGADLLVRALRELPPDLADRTVLLTMGRRGAELARGAGLPARDLGYLTDDHVKALAYSAADLFLFPTRADVFGLVSIEAQACGTPVVSFRVGGVPDHVRPGRTGLLAEPEDALGFRDAIALLLREEGVRQSMSERCRAVAEDEYDLGLEAARHATLYESILSESGAAGAEGVVLPPYPGVETGQRHTAEAPILPGGGRAGDASPLEPVAPDAEPG